MEGRKIRAEDLENLRRAEKMKLRKPSEVDRVAKRVLAPFIKRLNKQFTEKLFLKVDEEYQKAFMTSKMKDVITKLQSFCKDSLEVPTVLNETAEILKDVTKSTGVSSYLVDDSGEYLILNAKYMPQNGRHTVRYRIGPGETVAAYVAHSQEFVMSDDILGDSRFPHGIPGAGKIIKYVLCVPILTAVDGKCIAVVELFRDVDQEPYGSLDLQITVSMTGWMGAAIHQNNEKLFLLKKNELNNYLMSLVEAFFMRAINFDKFVTDIVECAKLSVQAERGSFYIMEEEVPEGSDRDIVADVYEEGIDPSHYTIKKKNKQRYSKNSTGFAGYVARQGVLINVQDALTDPRYQQGHDWRGLLTKSVISIPLKGSVGVLGILQLVNKVQEPYFTAKDETLLKSIASYAYLACQYNCLISDIKKSRFQNIGTTELLQVQMRPCVDDLRFLRYLPPFKRSDMPKGFFNFDWIVMGKEDQAPNYAVFMFTYLLGDQFFDYYRLTEFVLTVKKSYRDNPYHNFTHAFTVCHCMFNIIHRNRDRFTKLQIIALIIATICHDSDHVGFTNNFLELTNHWLCELYWESPLEHHHYDVCKLIIESTKLLANLSRQDYDEVQKLIRYLILATDLVQYFRNRNPLSNLLKSGTFDWTDPDHRNMSLGVTMTVCDVSGQCKPFYIAKKVTEGLYREFYRQGDVEKALGFTPLSMMDREKTASIPENQINFLSFVCIPSVEMVVSVFPNTEELLRQCVELKNCWIDILEKKVVEVWKMDEAIIPKMYHKLMPKKVTLT